MKKSLTVIIAGLMAGTVLSLAALPALGQVDVNIHLGQPIPPPVIYTTPAPVYGQPHTVYVESREPVHVVKVKQGKKHKRHKHNKHHKKHGKGHGNGHHKHHD